MKTFILGAGFSGLAAGINTNAVIFEKNNFAGGICRTYSKDGFQFSQGGGHWIFGKGKGLDFIKDLVKLNEYKRMATVVYNCAFPYPIQTTAQQTSHINKGTMKEWLSKHFSQAENNLFFYPFNEKYTAGIYNHIIQDEDYKTPKAGGVGFVPTFFDPEGGLGRLVNVMTDKCKIVFNKRATSIDHKKHEVFFSDSTKIQYNRLISTLPLDCLLRMCGKPNEDLVYTSVLVVNIGAIPGPLFPQDHWQYFPFCRSGFYRLGFYSNIDKGKAPKGMVSLSAEFAFFNKILTDVEKENICKALVQELKEWRYIDKEIVIDPTWVKCAYTWLKKKGSRERSLDWLKSKDIYSIGRYGKWKFQGMVESIADGLSVN